MDKAKGHGFEGGRWVREGLEDVVGGNGDNCTWPTTTTSLVCFIFIMYQRDGRKIDKIL